MISDKFTIPNRDLCGRISVVSGLDLGTIHKNPDVKKPGIV